MSDNRFGEKTILLNKEKVRSSMNAKTDEFLKEMVVFNVLSLWLYKKVVLRATGATSHSNHHSLIANLPDMSLLVKYMINDSIFEEKLGRTGMSNNTAISAFPDLFYIGSAHPSNGIALSRYVNSVRGNWDNFDLDNGSMSDTANDNGPESEPEDPNRTGDNPDDPDKLDGIYD
ncbi:hypothetical protein [uncultured Nostoc sp.]|uniref:hypothetical protein n=1 Tax=uncultured Nostoc sp. TaxID=340711 RepID=UPI0035CA2A85